MYITISPQKLGQAYTQSATDFVAYLEKENESLLPVGQEHFFNQYGNDIAPEEVISQIDGNTAKLEKTEPRFYSITISPSKYELKHLQNSSSLLQMYTREVMKDYIASFNREINGRPVNINDIKYFAKIEHERSFKGTDKQVRENQPYATKILELKNEIRNIEAGRTAGNTLLLKQRIAQLEKSAPHQQNGERIVPGMRKAGHQKHVHIIVSRKDASNQFSLSPGSKYKASEVELNGKLVKRGFDRDRFFKQAEKTFDRTFAYQRNFAETYAARKLFFKNTLGYFNTVMKLPLHERAVAMRILKETGMPMLPGIPKNQAEVAKKVFNRLRKGVETAIKSSSIGF